VSRHPTPPHYPSPPPAESQRPTSIGRLLWIGWCALWALAWGVSIAVGFLPGLLLCPASILAMFIGRPRRVEVVNLAPPYPYAYPPQPPQPRALPPTKR
jgi:hypothetical protein